MKTKKNKGIIAIVTCIVLFFVICSAFVINYNIKGTRAAATGCSSGYKVPAGNGNSYCCPNSTDSIISHNGSLYCVNSNYSNTTPSFVIESTTSGYTCVDYATVDTKNDNICSTTFGSNWIIANEPVYNGLNYKYTYKCSSSCATPVRALDVEDPNGGTEVKLTISYHSNDPGNLTKNVEVTAGSSHTIAEPFAPYNISYTFKEWNTKPDGTGEKYNPGFTFVTVSTDYDLYAIWDIETYGDEKVCYKCLAENSTEPVYTWNLKALKDSMFKGCDIMANVTTEPACEALSEEDEETETVKNLAIFKDQDHKILHQTSCTATKGQSCKIYAPTAPTKSGYTFLGWTTTGDNNCNGNYWQNSYWIADGLDFYACWKKNDDPKPPSSESNPPSSDNNGNVTENPKTGQIAIIAVWVIGLATIIYSVVYFAKMRKNN